MQVAMVGLILFGVFSSQAAHSVFIPTSDMVDVARAIARDEGFQVTDANKYYVDMLGTVNGQPRLDGFLTAAIYSNDQILFEISVNEKTGQVVDATRCLSFEFPVVMKFSEKVRAATGAKPLTRAELAVICGCNLKVERVPRPAK